MKNKPTVVSIFLIVTFFLAGCQRNRVEAYAIPTLIPLVSPAVPQADPPTEVPLPSPSLQPADPTAAPAAPTGEPAASPQSVLEATLPPAEPTAAEIYLPITTSQTVDVWAPAYLPESLRRSFAPYVRLAADAPQSSADPVLTLDVGGSQTVSRWVYALVTPFIGSARRGVQTITYVDLFAHWQGAGSGVVSSQPLFMSPETLDIFARYWGAPVPESVRVVPADRLLEETWALQRTLYNQVVLAFIPFEHIEPRWRVLPVDGQSPVYNTFDAAAYPLSVPLSISGDANLVSWVLAQNTPEAAVPFVMRSNREANRLTVLAVTGVTALVRATAFTMEQRGNLYPATDIGEILQAADITHISNEIPFAEDCPEPDPNSGSLVFCSQDDYIELLEYVGTDVVELTGDHFHDWGPEAMLHTVDMYNQRGWPYYGGGINLADGQRPAIIEHNGNKLAFMGCNGKGPFFARATETNPGSAFCDMPKMAAEVSRLLSEGYLVIFTFQHNEYYDYSFPADAADDFQLVADAGAVVVSGSQAHQPHEMEFRGAGFIHYGLGNLFFDQYNINEATRQGFIDRHIFYAGRYLGVELIPIYFVDYARARLMTDSESSALLTILFRTSGLIP